MSKVVLTDLKTLVENHDIKHVHGDWILLVSFTLDNDSSVNFTNLTSEYYCYVFIFDQLVPATDNDILFLRTSTTGGAPFDSGSGDYAQSSHSLDCDTTVVQFDGNDDFNNQAMCLGDHFGAIGSDTNEASDLILKVYNPTNTQLTKYYADGIFEDGGGTHRYCKTSGARLSSQSVTAISIYMNAGNLESGKIRLYGIKA